MRLGEDDKKMFEFARLVEGVSPRSGWEVMRVYLSERLKYVRMLFHEAALGDASLGDLAHIAGCENVCERIFSDLENFLCKPYCLELKDKCPHISADADVKALVDTLFGRLKEFQNVRFAGDWAETLAKLTEIRSKLREAIGHLKARAGEYVLLTNASAENFFRREVVLNRIESGRPFLFSSSSMIEGV